MSTSHIGFTLHYITLTNYLHCKGHIQITSNYRTIEVKAEEIEHLNESSRSLYLGLYYIILHIPTIILYRIHTDNK